METVLNNLDNQNGIWHTAGKGEVSYPSEGNDNCYQVEDKSFWFVHRNKCILALIDQYLPKDGLFLDVGGGNGFVAKAVQGAGYEVAMIEPYLTGCVNAKKRGVAHVINGDANAMNIPDGSFDALGIFDVLEHIEDRQTFLNNLRRLLKPSGKIFITVPAYQRLWSYEDEVAGHFLRYTRKTLDSCLTKAGFKTLFSSYFFSWLVFPIGLMRVVPYKLGKRQIGEVKQDHSEAKGIQKILAFEIKKIKKQKVINFGSSVIGVYGK